MKRSLIDTSRLDNQLLHTSLDDFRVFEPGSTKEGQDRTRGVMMYQLTRRIAVHLGLTRQKVADQITQFDLSRHRLTDGSELRITDIDDYVSACLRLEPDELPENMHPAQDKIRMIQQALVQKLEALLQEEADRGTELTKPTHADITCLLLSPDKLPNRFPDNPNKILISIREWALRHTDPRVDVSYPIPDDRRTSISGFQGALLRLPCLDLARAANCTMTYVKGEVCKHTSSELPIGVIFQTFVADL